ncbi:hypothetical protein AAC387_Pa01g1370 [Persea americana]
MCTIGSALPPARPDQICKPKSFEFLLFFDQTRFLLFVFCTATQDRGTVFFSIHGGRSVYSRCNSSSDSHNIFRCLIGLELLRRTWFVLMKMRPDQILLFGWGFSDFG